MYHIFSKVYDGNYPIGNRLTTTEVSITGNEIRSEMILSKSKFGAVDDDYINTSVYPRDRIGNTYSLEPQRIRTFMATLSAFTPPQQTKFENY